MALKTTRFISLYLTALLAGLLFCHLLELPNKMKLPAATWLTVQQTLYNMFGPVSSVIEPLAIVSTLVVLLIVRRRQPAFILTLIGLICLMAHLVSWLLVVNPVNLEVNAWTQAGIPGQWTHVRNRWEYGHAAGSALVLAALAALLAAAMADSDASSRARR
ncbi:MAG TPA: hypothetical protein VKB84_00985 [Candidatus Binataceae bacterium]|jgi:hypothetical protein|nr:hypothetical protein [Candidatus Binataceae bacterium]